MPVIELKGEPGGTMDEKEEVELNKISVSGRTLHSGYNQKPFYRIPSPPYSGKLRNTPDWAQWSLSGSCAL